MKRLMTLSIAAAGTIAAAFPALAEYPERPITLIVPWAAGGGTDAVGRTIAAELQERLGQSVNVVNRTGAGGVVGHAAMADAQPDGYTIGLATAEITTYNAMGTSDITSADVTPIALVNFDASAFNINADSEWETVDGALADIKAGPGEYTMSGMPVGAAYHLAFSAFLNNNNIDPKSVPVVPSQGAAPGFQELVAGGVDIVPSSLPEAQSMRQAGEVRTLAVLSDTRLDAFPDVPTVEEAIGEAAVGGTWRGIVGPPGLPDDIAGTIEEAVKAVYDSDAYQSFMDESGYGVRWMPSEEFDTFMRDAQESNAEIISKLGLGE